MPKRQDMNRLFKRGFMKQLQGAEVWMSSFSSFSVGYRGFRGEDSIYSSDKDEMHPVNTSKQSAHLYRREKGCSVENNTDLLL